MFCNLYQRKQSAFNVFIIALVIIFHFFLTNICFSQDINNNSTQEFNPVFLHPTQEEMEERKLINSLLIRAEAPVNPLPKGQKSLLNFMPYIGEERNQGACGNYWAWSATGAVEIQQAAFKNIYDRLSIQYINSNLFYPNYENYACNGGSTGYFTQVYSRMKKLVPWSNFYADFKDFLSIKICTNETGRRYSCPKVLPDEIQDDPSYEIASVDLLNLRNLGDDTKDIIQKIKYYINKDIPVVMDFCYTAANSFKRFLIDKNEDDIVDLSYIASDAPDNGTYSADCHSALILGYNDLLDNDDENYLEVLNSWELHKIDHMECLKQS